MNLNGWRTIAIENPAHLSLEQSSLAIRQEDAKIKIPIEDISCIVIDNYAVTVSANLLGELSNCNVSVIICDNKHTPSTIILPLSQHSRQAKISQQHVNMPSPLRKNLWQSIVKQKIINQAYVLSYFNHGTKAGQLIKLATEVRSGDTTNRESIAARIYFEALLEDATRRQPTWHNAALNYCYAIIRSVVARNIASRGLIPSLGLFHHNELNSFNLADDLIEPYRAIADLYVLSTMSHHRADSSSDNKLSGNDRHIALDILNNYVIIKNKQFALRDAVDLTVESLVRAIFLNDKTQLVLPHFTK